jgi:rSAM/selenodomain-associated transferase 2
MDQPGSILNDVSIIIPTDLGETGWKALLVDLQPLPPSVEILVVAVDMASAEHCTKENTMLPREITMLHSPRGRAKQMNRGATMADRPFLWFLHADSRIKSDAFEKLEAALREDPDAIHYFDLAFQEDGPRLAAVNAWGANLRSRFLHLPFGDQGLCLSKQQFHRLGGFDESVPYGEDHRLIWHAHRKRIPVRRIKAQIATSARKYRQYGWLRTTGFHLWQTASQATPQLARWITCHGDV